MSGGKNLGLMAGRYPAVVQSYNQSKRTCRISIPGMTDGGDVLPEAEIEYPIGDKSRSGANATELEITAGDTVWVAFIGGDPRYPIITGYRNPQAGNSADWRRIHHKNIEQLSDDTHHVQAGKTVKIDAGDTVEITAGTSITLKVGGATLLFNSSSITQTAGQISLNGAISGGGSGGATATFSGEVNVKKDVTAGSVSLQSHVHGGVQGGSSDTGTPK